MDFPDDWYLIHAAEHPLELRYLDDGKVRAEFDRLKIYITHAVGKLEQLRAERASLTPAWQPIETAPKDQSFLLGAWLDPAGIYWSRAVIRWFNRDVGDEGYWATYPGYANNNPTHWQPLPTPPVKEGA
jgi:hypothetical protein